VVPFQILSLPVGGYAEKLNTDYPTIMAFLLVSAIFLAVGIVVKKFYSILHKNSFTKFLGYFLVGLIALAV
jgi:hypothetical protein